MLYIYVYHSYSFIRIVVLVCPPMATKPTNHLFLNIRLDSFFGEDLQENMTDPVALNSIAPVMTPSRRREMKKKVVKLDEALDM